MNINTAEINECISNQFKAVATDERVQQLQRIAEIGDRLNELEKMHNQVDEQLDYPDDPDEIEFLRTMLRKINIEIQDLCAELEEYEKQEQLNFESELYGSFSGTIIDPSDPFYKPLGIGGKCLTHLTDESLPSWDWIGYVKIDNVNERAPVYTCYDIPEDRINDLHETIIPAGTCKPALCQIINTQDGFISYGVKYVTCDKTIDADTLDWRIFTKDTNRRYTERR